MKIQPHICLELFWLVKAAWSVQISRLIQTRPLYHWRKYNYGLWTYIEVKNVLMMDLFELLSSPDVNWWTGVVWIIVMFLSAVWTLILTAPIHCRASIAETLMQWHISPNLMKKQTHLNLGLPEGEDIFSQFSFFGWTIALKIITISLPYLILISLWLDVSCVMIIWPTRWFLTRCWSFSRVLNESITSVCCHVTVRLVWGVI